jgi:pilus assembly protein Flp/PilA
MLTIIQKLSVQAHVQRTRAARFLRDELGLTTVEYAIAGGLVGAAVIVAFVALGGNVGRIIQGISDALSEQ